MIKRTSTIDSILKILEELEEREEELRKKQKELLQWNDTIAKEIKEIEDGIKGIRLDEKIITRNKLEKFVERETKKLATLKERYNKKRDLLIEKELKRNEEVSRKISN
jgi:hypothetical protein